MKYFVVVKDSKGALLHNPGFKTLAEAQEHKLLCEDMKNYPKFPQKKNILKAEVSHIIPATPAVLDENGVVIVEEIPELKVIDSPEEFEMVPDYVVTIEDKTVEESAKEAKENLKLTKYQERIASLKALDWSNVKTIADIKPILKMLVDDLLKEQE